MSNSSRRPAKSRVGLSSPLGWQPSRFLNDRVEAERAYALAEQLGSMNAAAQELDNAWPSLRKARRGVSAHAVPLGVGCQ
jgi:hypothetical protein